MNDIFAVNIQPSKIHKIILLVCVIFSVSAILISEVPWVLVLLVFVFYYFSLKQINTQNLTKMILKQDKQQLFFKTKNKITKDLKAVYLTKYLTVLKYNHKNIVLFKDSFSDYSLKELNLFLKVYAFN